MTELPTWAPDSNYTVSTDTVAIGGTRGGDGPQKSTEHLVACFLAHDAGQSDSRSLSMPLWSLAPPVAPKCAARPVGNVEPGVVKLGTTTVGVDRASMHPSNDVVNVQSSGSKVDLNRRISTRCGSKEEK